MTLATVAPNGAPPHPVAHSPASHPMHLSELKLKKTAELTHVALGLGIENAGGLRRSDLIFAILKAESDKDVALSGEGVLETLEGGFGFLRSADANYLPGSDDIYVSHAQIRRFGLRTGDTVTGSIRSPKDSERYFALLHIDTVNSAKPETIAHTVHFENLTPTHPTRRFDLGAGPRGARLIDLVAPIGRGQRALVIAPPRTGRSTLLQELALGIAKSDAAVVSIVLLIDERPEDLAEMQRALRGKVTEVVGTTFDEKPERHLAVAEMVLEKSKRLCERGRDVVIFLDSLTRLARADSKPDIIDVARAKRFFSAARSLDEGGSLTILATALKDSCAADDRVLAELEGTPNCEIVLDPIVAERSVFPAIDVGKSGTRKKRQQMPTARAQAVAQLRKELLGEHDAADALAQLLARIDRYPHNDDLLEALAK